MRKDHLRKLAQGQQCQVRLDGCTWDDACLAHIRRGNIGMGKKPNDLCGVYACHNCHDKIDGRQTPRASDKQILEALCRTLEIAGGHLGI